MDLIRKANPNMMKEYHFDPNMGQSLEEHIKEISVPGIKVETWLDREGNTIVWKSIANNFEFNLDEVMNTTENKFKELLS